MTTTFGYYQLPTGFWIKQNDGTGPYVRTADGTWALAGTGTGGGGGGGDATAANQSTQITLATTANSSLGTIATNTGTTATNTGTTATNTGTTATNTGTIVTNTGNTATNTSTTATNTGTIATNTGTTATNTTNANTLIGAVTETAPASDTASSGLNGRLQRIAQRLTSLIALLPASLGVKTAAASLSVAPASDATFALTSVGYGSQPTVTRPANTTAYTAGDVVGGAITFTSAGPTAGHVMITSAALRYDVAAIPSGMTSFRLHLYNATPPSALADNAAFDLPSGDRSAYLGYIDLGTVADFGATLFTQVDAVNHQAKLASAETSLYGYLVTTGAYTPANNSEVFAPLLRAVAL